jgi:hypothetical protein
MKNRVRGALSTRRLRPGGGVTVRRHYDCLAAGLIDPASEVHGSGKRITHEHDTPARRRSGPPRRRSGGITHQRDQSGMRAAVTAAEGAHHFPH